MTICKNCKEEVVGNFCQNCGHPLLPRRINRQYIVDEMSGILNLEKGFFYTIKEMFVRPGITVNKFIGGDRSKIVKPILFLIICSLIYTVGQQYLNFEAGLIRFKVADTEEMPAMLKIYEWFSSNYGYANILLAIFISFWVKVLFRGYDYNYYEIYILLCYIMGNSILIYTFLGIIDSLIGNNILRIGIITSVIYNTWAIGQFFDRRKKMSYFKGFASYLLGFFSSVATLIIIGIGIDKLM